VQEVEFLFFLMMFKDLARIVGAIAAMDVETEPANKSLKREKNMRQIIRANE
jgi:hypothetical protein